MGGRATLLAPLVGRESELSTAQGWLDNGTHVLLTGPIGIGKTRLAREIGLAQPPDRPVDDLIASPALSAVAYGALANVGFPDRRFQHGGHSLATWYRQRWRRLGRHHHRPLVIVDDVQHLDRLSAELLREEARHHHITVLVSARSDHELPLAIDELFAERSLAHIPLAPLGHGATKHLIDTLRDAGERSTFAGRPSTSAAATEPRDSLEELTALAGGVPLYARELLWARDNDLGRDSAIDVLLGWRLAGLSSDARRAAHYLAVDGDLPADLLDLIGLGEARRELCAHGFAEIRSERLRYADPLAEHYFRELERAAPCSGELLDHCRAADVALDIWVHAAWSARAGRTLAPDKAVAAARSELDRMNPQAALRFLDGQPPTTESVLATIEAEFLLGRNRRAAGRCAHLEREASRATRCEIALVSARIAASVDHDLVRAQRELRRASSLAGPGDAGRLLALEVSLGLLGDGLPAWKALETYLHEPAMQGALEVAVGAVGLSAANGSTALTASWIGPTERLIAPSGVTMTARAVFHLALADLCCGHTVAAIDRLRLAVGDAIDNRDPFGVAMTGGLLSTIEGWSGQIDRAAERAMGSLRNPSGMRGRVPSNIDPDGTTRLARASLLGAHCRRGDVLAADELRPQVQADGAASDFGHLVASQALWLHDRLRFAQPAGDGLARTERLLVDHGKPAWASLLYLDVLDRRPDRALAERLDALGSQADGGLAPLVADLAIGWFAADPHRLERSAVGLEQRHFWLPAARAWAALNRAAWANRSADDRAKTAFRAELGAQRCLDRCHGLHGRWHPPTKAVLTHSQRLVATATAAGESRRAYAARSHLAIKTVHNHLHHVHKRLGIRSHDELAELFVPPPPHPRTGAGDARRVPRG